MEKLKIRIHNTASNVTVLGPGHRFVIWTQGCLRHCEGCIAPEAQPLEGGRLVDVDTLAADILRTERLEGLTLSGGEPFLQSRALCALVECIRRQRAVGVIAYTGYTLEALRALYDPDVEALLGLIDTLIDGPYVETLNDDLGLRGSSNQRLIHLTPRYADGMADFGRAGARNMQYSVAEGGFFAVGIPTRKCLDLLKPRADFRREDADNHCF